MQFNNFCLIDDDTASNFFNKKLVQHDKFAKKFKIYNYANIALEELRKLLPDSAEFPDIILLDIKMPYMDGWQFLEEFKKFPEAILSKCKLFMFSSSEDPKDVEKSKTYEIVNGFISKPLTSDKLHDLISPDRKAEAI